MEKIKESEQPELQSNWVPETPAKTARLLNVYTKRSRKGNSECGSLARICKQQAQDKKASVFVATMTSGEKNQEQKNQKSPSTEFSCIDSVGLIDKHMNVYDLELNNVGVGVGASSSKDSGNLGKGITESAMGDHEKESACFIVNNSKNSGEGNYACEETVDSQGDVNAWTGNVARRLDFSASGDSNIDLGDWNVQSVSNPSTGLLRSATTHIEDQSSSQDSSSAPMEGAIDGRVGTSFQVSTSQIDQIDRNTSQLGVDNLLNLEQDHNKNDPESHLPQYDGLKNLEGDFISQVENEKIHSDELFEPATPMLKQTFNKRSRNSTYENERPSKRSKTKRKRHRPKVAGTIKRRVKSSPEKKENRNYVRKTPSNKKETRKYVSKTPSKEKEKRKYVRKSSTAEHHTESVAAKLSLFRLEDQPKDMTAIWDPKFEMESVLQFDVGKNMGQQNILGGFSLDINSSKWSLGKRSAGDYCRNLIEEEYCLISSRKVEPSFPLACKQRRAKRQRKLKLSILLRFLFLQLPGHVKKKRCKICFQRRNRMSCSVVPRLSIPLNQTLPCNNSQVALEGKTLNGETKRLKESVSSHLITPEQGGEINEPITAIFPEFSLHQDCHLPTLEQSEQPVYEQFCISSQEQFLYGRALLGNYIQKELSLQQTSKGPKKGFNSRKRKNVSIDDLIVELRSLTICDLVTKRGSRSIKRGTHSTKIRESSAIVPQQGSPKRDLAIVPYGGFDSIKFGDSRAIVPNRGSSKRKLKAQVLLTKETLRQWNLLMKINDSLGEGKEDKESQKKWEEEREIFHGRIKSFTSRMHIILGDRRFKPWKGSVVDSVIGVYLTQNVTDFLSSGAYMLLASKFPVQSTSNEEESDDELEDKYTQESRGNIVCPGTKQDSYNGYFVTEPELETPVDVVSLGNVDDTGNTNLQESKKIQPCESPDTASGGKKGINPISSSDMLNSQETTFEMPHSSSASNSSHLIEDYEAENVVEEKELPDIGFLPQDCISKAEVGIESNVHSWNALNDKPLNVPEDIVRQDSALSPTTPATSMKNRRSGLSPGETIKTARFKQNVVKKEPSYWTDLGKKYSRPRSKAETDSVDWEAVRQAPESEIADAIKSRGQHNIMATKIKKVLNRIVEYHGSIDLEWLRQAPDDDVKDYLLEIKGLGLKSVECLRLLTLKHVAFPVDTNVARIAVRLGWVPLEPLPGDLQLHLLEEYPNMDSIQVYLWPLLCNLDQRTLYELHYQMITFGKVFCTKLNPNCGVCPMRAECRHLASAIASQNLCLPGPSKKDEEISKVPSLSLANSTAVDNNALIVPTIGYISKPFITSESSCESELRTQTCEPFIEEPKSPEVENDIENFGIDYGIDEMDEEEIPTIKLSNEPFRENVQYFINKYSLSRAVVPLSVNVDSVPIRKLKNISRLRTEHQVYEVPDDHQLLIRHRKRDANRDQSPYLLAIWTPGETAGSCQPPKKTCNSQGSEICKDLTCFSCQSIWEQRTETVRGTILVPCRTAMRGRFPLNGTYFQVNEVFADHETSYNPIIVPRSSLWYLRKRTVYFGTSPNAIFKACSLKDIQENFWKGFICVRGWDAKSGAPRPLSRRFHCPPSKMEKTSKRMTKLDDAKDAKGKPNMSFPAS